ncbi:AAR2 protein-domain-containing protein [Parachaetomium inaequale]|uniref:AAR2 protein-domain-containing protein n=1 Tax=Parachaetomium inaequale TaxID=2588326 RepID=A0AAN6PLM1_9PEZI|nr:AAR2 protein-domain-containing protein [Parachaetomium inaequale]
MDTKPGHAATPKAEEAAQRRPAYFGKGDVFRALGLPSDFIIGLDAMAMTTNKSLEGFRDIPPGAHLLWVQQPGSVSRCGYWFITGAQGVPRTKEWDRYNEVLAEPASQSEARNSRGNMEFIYPSLQPYTLHDHGKRPPVPLNDTLPDWARSPAHLWNALTSAISAQALSRITGKQNLEEYLVDSMDCAKDEGLSASRAPVATTNNELNFLFAQDFRDLQVLDLGSMKARVADTSARVQTLLTSTATNNKNNNSPLTELDILAELQFTFLTGTHLGNPACLEQWWNLVLKIVLRAYTLGTSHPQLTRDLLQTLHAQLLYSEHYFASSATSSSSSSPQADRFDDGGKRAKDGPSSDTPVFEYKPLYKGKLRQMLVEYKTQLSQLLVGRDDHGATPEQEAVAAAFEELEAWLWRKGWDLRVRGEESRPENGGDGVDVGVDSEDEEDEQPVVVELDGEGREVGLVSFRD